MSKARLAALAATTVTAVVGAVAPIAGAADPVVVDMSLCTLPTEFGGGGGNAAVPAGAMVTVQLGNVTSGTYGGIVNFLKKQQTTVTIVTNGGTPTVIDVSGSWSQPYQLPTGEWQASLSTVDLGVLAAGDTVRVTQEGSLRGPVNFVFPPTGKTQFGPFLVRGGGSQECVITAV